MSIISQTSIDQILATFRQFSNYEGKNICEQSSGYEATVVSKIKSFEAAKEPISMILPAFPWKNPNTEKVLGPNPDLGEELGLARLNHLCEEISKLYPYKAYVTLIADGPVYNDLLGIPAADFYDYGIQLRAMAEEKGFMHIKFRRLMDVLDLGDGDKMSRSDYIARCEMFQHEMESKFLNSNFNLDHEIKRSKDTDLTYQKFIRSAREDLRWGPDIDTAIKVDAEIYSTETTRVARRMMNRLIAYERALQSKYAEFIRLSIHASTGKGKISVPLIPQSGVFGLMPWHSCVVVTADGQFHTCHANDFRSLNSYELILKDGKPYCLREKHSLFNWPAHIQIYHEYGGQVIVVNTSTDETKRTLSKDERLKVAELGIAFGGVRVDGFKL